MIVELSLVVFLSWMIILLVVQINGTLTDWQDENICKDFTLWHCYMYNPNEKSFFPLFCMKNVYIINKKEGIFYFLFLFLFQKRKKKKTKSDIENNVILAEFVSVLASTLEVLTLLLDSSQLVMWLNFFCAKILFILSIICHHIRRCED